MNKTICFVLLIVAAALVLACAICAPGVLSDQNTFFVTFIGPDLLEILGVILAITLASSAQLHLEFNKIEERFKMRGLTKTRASVRQDTYALIFLFVIGIAIVVCKPLLAAADWSQTIFNGLALLVLLANVLLLVSLTRTTFSISPHIADD
jgi:hypothetical protein